MSERIGYSDPKVVHLIERSDAVRGGDVFVAPVREFAKREDKLMADEAVNNILEADQEKLKREKSFQEIEALLAQPNTPDKVQSQAGKKSLFNRSRFPFLPPVSADNGIEKGPGGGGYGDGEGGSPAGQEKTVHQDPGQSVNQERRAKQAEIAHRNSRMVMRTNKIR